MAGKPKRTLRKFEVHIHGNATSFPILADDYRTLPDRFIHFSVAGETVAIFNVAHVAAIIFEDELSAAADSFTASEQRK
ncbi:MAG TPA: hypothetical protein VIJ06_05850 [Methylovirgula sp.]